MWWLWSMAQAGSLTLTLDSAGEKNTVTLDDMAPCERTSLKVGAFPDVLEVSARVEPREGKELVVAVEVERRRGEERMELRPTLLLTEGQKGVFRVDVADAKSTLDVSARGFEGLVCPTTHSRTARTETRRTETP